MKKMKTINKKIKNIISTQEINITNFPYSEEIKFEDSPLKNSTNLNFGLTIKPCFLCKEKCTDYCWNCEKALCDKHRYILSIKMKLMCMVSICQECKNLIINQGISLNDI